MSAVGAAALAAVLAPALAAAAGLPAVRWGRKACVATGVAGGAVALLAAVVELATAGGPAYAARSTTGLGVADTGDVVVHLSVHGDGLSALVAIAVGVVALSVQVYSAAYLPGPGTADAPTRYAAYAAEVSLFTAAMMLVVHAADLVPMLIGWEVMGICSYLLIGHHSERPAARRAAVKAFLVTRVGDVGFLLGVVVLLVGAHTSSLAELLDPQLRGGTPGWVWTAGTMGLLIGVVGKSAQFPLQTWLPDAMEGPTPISALIHAATMVAAGIYVLARLHPLLVLAPATAAIAAIVAAVSMLGAALAALAASDLKRLLAWSTISQVAYMLGALAVGAGAQAASASVLHLLSHAAFKALLFLAAGCIAHLVGSTMLVDLGGLRWSAPKLAVVLGLGLAALAGLPPLSGFFSKEAVLSAVTEGTTHAAAPGWAAWTLLVVGLVTSVVTGGYAARAFCVVVLGPAPQAPAHPLPRAMTAPLVVLAVPTVALGAVLVHPPAQLAGAGLGLVTAVIGTLLAVAGGAVGLAGARRPSRDVADLLPAAVRSLLHNGFGWDAVQHRLVVRPVLGLARAVARGDRDVVDAYVRGAAAGSRWGGVALARLQTGVTTGYLAWLVAGALGLAVLALVVT